MNYQQAQQTSLFELSREDYTADFNVRNRQDITSILHDRYGYMIELNDHIIEIPEHNCYLVVSGVELSFFNRVRRMIQEYYIPSEEIDGLLLDLNVIVENAFNTPRVDEYPRD